MRAVNEEPGFAGLVPSGPWSGIAAKLLSFDKMRHTYESVRTVENGRSFPERLLDFLKVRYAAAPGDLKQVPAKGAAVVVANHPFGLLEAAVLVSVLRQVRHDVRVLTNEVLDQIPELREFMIPVDVLSGDRRANVAGVRRALEFLTGGGLLLIFPAGAVSHFQWKRRASVDPAWNPTVARLILLAARNSRLAIVPVYVPGSNSFLFHAAGMAHSSLRTAMLAREFVNKTETAVELRIGRAVASSKLLAMKSDEERIQYLRWRTYLLAGRQPFKPQSFRPKTRRMLGGATPAKKPAEIVAPVCPAGPTKSRACRARRCSTNPEICKFT